MRVGLIGYGLAGRVFHAPLLQAAGFFVAAIASRSLEKRGEAHRDFPLASILASAEELVAEDLDLVVVASTNQFHAEHARLAIASGIPVVVDKPMGIDYFETRALFDLAEEKNVPITVFFNRLYDSDTLTIKELLSTDELGEVFRFESRYERFRPNLNLQSWRETTSPEFGGGLLLDLQTHLVSSAIELFGPARLEFASLRRIRGDVEDDAFLSLRHDSGVDSYLSVSSISGAPGPRARLSGSKGALIVSDVDPQEGLLRSGEKPLQTGWRDAKSATSEFRIHRGGESFNYSGVPGNYISFYLEVAKALSQAGEFPVARDLALEVARILDTAREMDIRR